VQLLQGRCPYFISSVSNLRKPLNNQGLQPLFLQNLLNLPLQHLPRCSNQSYELMGTYLLARGCVPSKRD
jgi:hypothetical protein